MLDIKVIRNNPSLVKEAMKKRNCNMDKKIELMRHVLKDRCAKMYW